MAKKSKIAKNEQRKEIVARYAERRNELKAIIKNPETCLLYTSPSPRDS